MDEVAEGGVVPKVTSGGNREPGTGNGEQGSEIGSPDGNG
jgi:hypothetical protein